MTMMISKNRYALMCIGACFVGLVLGNSGAGLMVMLVPFALAIIFFAKSFRG